MTHPVLFVVDDDATNPNAAQLVAQSEWSDDVVRSGPLKSGAAVKPLEAELVMLYCKQARQSVARVSQLTPEQRAADGSYESRLDEALAALSNLERAVAKATRPTR